MTFLFWAFACGGESEQAAVPTPTVQVAADGPDLVVLLTAGLRADPPGSRGPASRFWEGFGTAPTIRFDAAYAQSSATFLSLGSLLTGRYPSSIPMCGLFTDGVSAVETRVVQGNAEQNRLWCANIPERVPTAPEVLALYGYRTALVTAGIPGAGILRRGFQQVAEAPFSPVEGTDWAALTAETSAWWRDNAAAPRLLVVVTADTQVTDRPAVLDRMGVHLMLAEGAPVFDPARTDADPAVVEKVYGDLAEGAGEGLGKVLGGLDGDRERWAFVSSTNGVSLIEPTGFFDMPVPLATTSYMLDRTARVPLGVYGPASESGATDRVVELLDLMPTLTRLAGAVAPAGIPGADLLAGPLAGDGTEYAYGEFGDTLLYRKGRHELLFRAFLHHGTVLDPQLDERLRDPASQKYFTLHDVVSDPMQRDNLSMNRGDLFQPLRREIMSVRAGVAAPPQGTWDDPQRLWEIRMARSHGYW